MTPGVGAPGLPRGAVPITSVTLGGGGFDLTDWSVWWRFNQHEYLQLKDHVWATGPRTGDASFILGTGQQALPVGELKPSDEVLTLTVAPALKRALRFHSQPAVLSGCMTALAKLGELPYGEEELSSAALITHFLQHPNQEVRETAALALGILGDAANLEALASVLEGDDAARELVGRRGTDTRTRAFAAYGLGVLAQRNGQVDVQRYVAHQLLTVLEARERGTHDLAVACVNALALVKLPSRKDSDLELEREPPSSSREALVVYLLGLLDDRRLPERVKAHVPRALARLIDPYDDPQKERVAIALSSRIAHARRTGREIQYGAIQALGLLGTAGSRPVDARIRAALREAFSRGDLTARNLSLIAMAKVGARAHPGSPDPVAGLAPIRAHLLETLARGKSRTRPWAALALGVHGFFAKEARLSLSEDVSAALRRAFDETRSPSDAGVYALALGLRSDLQSGARILERLDEFRVVQTRGHIALALGLLPEPHAGSALHELLTEARWRPDLFRPVATSLAMIGDKSLVPELVGNLDAAGSNAVKTVHVWALAWTGDVRAVQPTLALLETPGLPLSTYEVASVALGWMSERERLPWNTWLSSDSNYMAAPSTLTSPRGGGVLDIR